jgi:hypothetical protein
MAQSLRNQQEIADLLNRCARHVRLAPTCHAPACVVRALRATGVLRAHEL